MSIFVGGLITLPCYLFWIRKYIVPRFSYPPIEPEVILPPTFFGACSLPICLFWYGWTSNENIHWMVPIVGSGLFTISIITLFMPISRDGISQICSIGTCRKHPFQSNMWGSISIICETLGFLVSLQ